MRYRAQDFAPLRHLGGTMPGWPFRHEEIERFYQEAEQLYQVRGALGEDPTEPPHSGDYPHPPVPDEPPIADLRRRLRGVGLHPSSLPLGVNIEHWLAHGRTLWDTFPDTQGGKMDAETVGLAQALQYPNVTLLEGVRVRRLLAGPDGRVTGVVVEREGAAETLSAPIVVLSAGAVNSAALLLASADERHPRGLANASDQVGRNFMNHNLSAVLGLHPLRRNDSVYQKTIKANDFYLTGGPNGEPLGNSQMLGKISGTILASDTVLPRPLATWIANHSVHLLAMSEDLPNPQSLVMLRDGRIMLDWSDRTGPRTRRWWRGSGRSCGGRAIRWSCRVPSTGARRRTSAAPRAWVRTRAPALWTPSAARTITRTCSSSTPQSCPPRLP